VIDAPHPKDVSYKSISPNRKKEPKTTWTTNNVTANKNWGTQDKNAMLIVREEPMTVFWSTLSDRGVKRLREYSFYGEKKQKQTKKTSSQTAMHNSRGQKP